MSNVDLHFAEEAVSRAGQDPEALISILHSLQEHYGYLPEPVLRRVCELTKITPANLAGVSTFYDRFRHRPSGRHIVQICRGTACHVAGSHRIEEELRRQLLIPPGADTDPEGRFTLEPVACLGCCTLAPVMRMGAKTAGGVTSESAPRLLQDYVRDVAKGRIESASTEDSIRRSGNHCAEIHVGLGSCCMAKGSDRVFQALRQSARDFGGDVVVKRVGCVGMCHRTPLVEVALPGQPGEFYSNLTPAQARALLERHFQSGGRAGQAVRLWSRILDGMLFDLTPQAGVERRAMNSREPGVRAFFQRQRHIATEHFGKLDPLDLQEYLRHDGFAALQKCLPGKSSGPAIPANDLIKLIEDSGLRGRGGAGFPTGRKWRTVGQQTKPAKFVICNGDEGDPGAFMDRMILESFPFRVIEGLAIAAVAVGAHEAIFYVRHEYPLAVKRVRAAVSALEDCGWLGPRLFGSDYPLRIALREGAGAFVCGEETALIASLEGRRGLPRLRPPFPAESGYHGQPTLVNNVETLAVVPWIVRNGAAAFSNIGTPRSKGTKVFALAGQVRRGGLIEVPMGTTIREIVEEIGGGVAEGRRFKAVQIGGPSGGCVPARLSETPIDYESLGEVGAIMGSGGLIVMDDRTCMVDIARYFLSFTQEQSCGKCTFCRIGTKRMLEILECLCAGKARREQLDELEHLARQVGAGSLCGLGRTAPNPVLSTLKYFRDEYDAHLQGRCPAGRCSALIHYQVTADCTGCTICAQHCPVQAIPWTPYQRHEIKQDLCTRCDTCRQVCPHEAIQVQ